MISMFQASVPPCLRALESLTALLDKAVAHCEARKIDPAALLQARLFPDMLPFTRQVQMAADAAKFTGARLAGITPPSDPDTEATFPELRARVAKTVAFLKTLTPEQMEGAATREVTMSVRRGKLTMTGLEYLQAMGLPNMYFHVTTAYDLLRHNGLEVGKLDYLGGLPGTLQEG